MSHFTVLVIGDNPEEQLAPFHEFECTGYNDQYVQDIDMTERVKKEYNESSQYMLKDSSGKLYDKYSDEFYRDPTEEELKQIGSAGGSGHCSGFSFSSKNWGDGLGYRPKIKYTPIDLVEVELKTSEVMSFAAWLKDEYGRESILEGELPDIENKHKYGYAVVDSNGDVVRFIKRTNPNARWDWYVLGGRWSNFFLLKDGSRADSALWKDIDFIGMIDEETKEAEASYTKYCSVKNNYPDVKGWNECRKMFNDDIEKARKFYHEQDGIKEINKITNLFLDCPIDYYGKALGGFLAKRINNVGVTFAVIDNGKWYEKGKMGWWAYVSDAMDESMWKDKVSELYNSLSPDTLVSVYDCHI